MIDIRSQRPRGGQYAKFEKFIPGYSDRLLLFSRRIRIYVRGVLYLHPAVGTFQLYK